MRIVKIENLTKKYGKNTILKDIHTSNHYQAGIRLKNASEVTLLGVNSHKGDSHQLALDNSNPNTFNNNGQYVETSKNRNISWRWT